jgi:hypothetical protein
VLQSWVEEGWIDIAAPNEPGRRRPTLVPILPLRTVMSERAAASLPFGGDGDELERGRLAMMLVVVGGGPDGM